MSFVEFQVFDGVSGELRPWISWLEEFFVREKFTADEKMNLAQSLLEGKAEAWFYRNQKILPFQSWDDLKANLWLMFGDFEDSDRFLRRKRMETTSLNLQESISSMATITEAITVEKYANQRKIVEESSESVAEILDERASEKKLIPQYQVPVSFLEPSLRFSCESLVVSGASAKESIEKDESHEAKMVKVENETAMFHKLAGISSAYQVFDKKSPHKERLKSKPKRKLSLSPKTWMFKFKNKNLQRQYSCSRATFGYKWKEHNFRYWRRIRQTHLSRLLCISQTNAEKALEALKKIQFQQATVMCDGTKVPSLSAKELVPGDIVELRDGDKVPADMRMLVLISSTLGVEQGSLTGECEAVSNTTKPVDVNADIQEKKCMVFAGTTGICSDNTGTLTTNQMAVSKLVARGSRTGTLRSDQLWSELEQRIATLEFDSDRKSMGVLVDSSSGNKFLLVKGAVENVLDRSTRIQLLAGSVQELDQYSRDLINTRIFQGRWCMNLPGQLKSLSIWHRWRRKD